MLPPRPKRFTRRQLTSASVAVALGACAGTGARPQPTAGHVVGGVVVGSPLPDVRFVALGTTTSTRVSQLRGHVVLLDVWASWCEPCKVELPLLDDIAKRLGVRGVVIAAVSIDQDEANVHRFLRTRKTWSVRFFHDPAGVVAERLAPPKMPTSYLLDRQGLVREVNTGFERADAPRLERALAALAGT